MAGFYMADAFLGGFNIFNIAVFLCLKMKMDVL